MRNNAITKWKIKKTLFSLPAGLNNTRVYNIIYTYTPKKHDTAYTTIVIIDIILYYNNDIVHMRFLSALHESCVSYTILILI